MSRGRKKTTTKVATQEEIEQAGLKPDYYSNRRSSSGFIKIGLNDRGVKILNESVEEEIERKQEELKRLKAQYAKLEDMEEEIKIKSKKSKKQKKKEKKRKKKQKKKMRQLPETSRILLGAIEEYKEKYHKPKKKSKHEYEGVSSKPKGSTKKKTPEDEEAAEKRKQEREKKEFDKKFEEPITLLRQTVVEVDKALQDVDSLIKETRESRARNKATMLKDLFSAKVGLLGNRTQNARAIGDLQKTRMDLEMRRIKEEASKGNERNQNIALIAKAFPQLVAQSGGGAGGAKSLAEASIKEPKKDKKENKKEKKSKRNKYREENEEKFVERAAELVRSGKINISPHEAAIDMEGKYTIAIKKSFKTHDWEFIAVDNNGMEIRDFKRKYPGLLPKKKNHDIRFDDEKDIAKCSRTSEVFQVIAVPYV